MRPEDRQAAKERGRPLRLVVTGGGTGGHVYPGLAVVEAVRTLDPDSDAVWFGTRRGIEARLAPTAGLAFVALPASGFRGHSLLGRLLFLINLAAGFLRSGLRLLFRRPDVVLGTGGYVSLGVGLAARSLGIPLVLQEQNAIPGSTNRVLGRWASRIYLGFGAAKQWFPADRCRETGNPVRSILTEAFTRSERSPLEGRALRILVTGGSGGARTLNRAVAAAAAGAWAARDDIELRVQTGTHDRGVVAAACAARAGRTEVMEYIDDMPAALNWADLVICRAGAMTLAELAAAGRPSILVPFPHATDQHQLLNARERESAGASFLLLDELCDGETLAGCVEALRVEPGRLDAMRRAAARQARPEAAMIIATDLMRLTGRLPAVEGEPFVP